MTVGVLGVDRRRGDGGTTARPSFASGPAARGSRPSSGPSTGRATGGRRPGPRRARRPVRARARAGRRVPRRPAGVARPRRGREQGAGRACEREARTQGKAGPRGTCYPGTQRRWFELGIDVFAALLRRPDVVLVNDVGVSTLAVPARGYYVLEAFPTSVWRATGLAPLPGKRAAGRRRVRPAARAGVRPALVASPRPSHDDLQALVAALPPAAPRRAGPRAAARRSGRAADGGLVEGLIWDAAPTAPRRPRRRRPRERGAASLVVTGAPASGKTSLPRSSRSACAFPSSARTRSRSGSTRSSAQATARGADRGGRPRDPVLGRRAAARVRRLRHRGEQLRRGDGRRAVRPSVASTGHGSSSSTAPAPRSSSWSALRSGSRRASATRATATSPRTSARCARSSRPASGIRSTSPAS